MKATSLMIENTEIKVPSHADIVEGLTEKIDTQIAAYDSSTINAKISGLANVYLGKTAKAADSSKADYATAAGKATLDGNGNNISTTYYKKSDTVDKASKDSDGNSIKDNYALKNGSYTSLKAGYATTAGGADYATLDKAGGNNIRGTYIKNIENRNGTQTITFTRGDNTTGTFSTYAPSLELASTVSSGLMSSDDKVNLNALSSKIINGHELSSASSIRFYGTCETAADNPAKIVTCAGYKKLAGNLIAIRFTNTNTCTSGVTININDTGAQPVQKGNYFIHNFVNYPGQILWMAQMNSYLALVEDSPVTTIQLTGDVTAEGTFGVSKVLSLSTTLNDDAAFKYTVIKPNEQSDYSDGYASINNIKSCGYYYIYPGSSTIGYWDNLPSTVDARYACFLQVTSRASGHVVQEFFDTYGSLYSRVFRNGAWGAWRKYAYETVTDAVHSS